MAAPDQTIIAMHMENHHSNCIISALDRLLEQYLSSYRPAKLGIPSVAYCADKVHLSANYFGSLVKKETGQTAKDYIRGKIVEEAKFRILARDKNINEIAYELGFRYPQHFSRCFKNFVGQSPKKYRYTNLDVMAFNCTE